MTSFHRHWHIDYLHQIIRIRAGWKTFLYGAFRPYEAEPAGVFNWNPDIEAFDEPADELSDRL